MDTLWKIVAWLKALSFVSKIASVFSGLGGLVGLIPGVGPVGGLIAAVLTLLAKGVTYLIKSFIECVTDPMTWGVVAVMWAWGVTVGIKWDAHLVDVANGHLRQYAQAAKGAVNVEKAKADAAERAAAAAEQQAKNAPAPPPLKCAENTNSAVTTKPSVVRQYRPRAKPSNSAIPGLPGF